MPSRSSCPAPNPTASRATGRPSAATCATRHGCGWRRSDSDTASNDGFRPAPRCAHYPASGRRAPAPSGTRASGSSVVSWRLCLMIFRRSAFGLRCDYSIFIRSLAVARSDDASAPSRRRRACARSITEPIQPSSSATAVYHRTYKCTTTPGRDSEHARAAASAWLAPAGTRNQASSPSARQLAACVRRLRQSAPHLTCAYCSPCPRRWR